MSDGSPAARAMASRGWMVVLSATVVFGVLLYYGFLAVEGWGLPQQERVASVTAKEYREASTTYATQKVGDRMLTLPQTIPPMHVLKLDLDGSVAEAPVDKALYDSVLAGDELRVVYTASRIRGRIQILEVVTK